MQTVIKDQLPDIVLNKKLISKHCDTWFYVSLDYN